MQKNEKTSEEPSRVKTLQGLAFRTSFSPARLQKPKEIESMQMLREDNERREQLGFTLNQLSIPMEWT